AASPEAQPSPPGFFRSVKNTFSVLVGRNPEACTLEEVQKLKKRANWLKAVFTGLGIIGALFAMWKAIKPSDSPAEPEADPEDSLEKIPESQ
nr:3A [Oscivirus A1]